MAEINGNVVLDIEKPISELYDEIGKLREELVDAINDNIIQDFGRSASELLDEIYSLREEITIVKRSAGQKKKKAVVTKAENVVLNSRTARSAVIYSEILGKPISRRR